jgi:Cu-Zn family superoxide dismutase
MSSIDTEEATMRKVLLIVAGAALIAAFASCAGHKATSGGGAPEAPSSAAATAAASAEPKAHAKLEPRSGSDVKGTAEFVERGGKVTLTLTVSGLTPGEHAFHLHEKGDCSAPDATSAGGHWNPTTEGHGKWGTHPFHRGDVANLVADASGNAKLTFATDLWSIGGDPSRDVVGHALIIHAKPDDFTTQPTGNAGGRVACGVIEK